MTDCDYCNDIPGDLVPGEPIDNRWDIDCHCGHPWEAHSFHVLFCRRCECYSLHFPGETYDDIHDRWN